MLWYTLKRIGLIIPTLLVVALLTFGLNECTPGDPVLARIPEDNQLSSILETELLFRKQYRIASHSIGKDLPLFYFSLSSQAYPDTLHRVIPLADQQNTRQLIARHGNWPAIQNYLTELRTTSFLFMDLQDTYSYDPLIETSRQIQALSIQSDPLKISTTVETLQQNIAQDSLLAPLALAQMNMLNAAHQNLTQSTQSWKHYLPAFYWHGRANQFHHWLARVIRGDLGKSLASSQAVGVKIKNALRWTLQLNGVAILLAYLLAIPLGVYSAMKAGSRFDRWLSIGLFFLFAIPSFWTATLLSKFLTTPEWLDLFPSMGVGEVSETATWWQVISIRAEHFFLPIFCLTYASLAYLTRQVRANMMGVLQSDFVRTARAKGLPERQVIWRHAFPNALFPLITLFASLLPRAIAGSIIIEQIFNIPGIGKLTIDSIYSGDWPIVYGLLLLTAVCTIIGILLSDLLYAWADPRVQLNEVKAAAHV